MLVARWTRANCQTVALHHCSALPAPHGACAAPAPRPSTELRRFSRTRTKKRPGTGTAAAPGGAYVLGPVPRHTSRVGLAVTRSRRCYKQTRDIRCAAVFRSRGRSRNSGPAVTLLTHFQPTFTSCPISPFLPLPCVSPPRALELWSTGPGWLSCSPSS